MLAAAAAAPSSEEEEFFINREEEIDDDGAEGASTKAGDLEEARSFSSTSFPTYRASSCEGNTALVEEDCFVVVEEEDCFVVVEEEDCFVVEYEDCMEEEDCLAEVEANRGEPVSTLYRPSLDLQSTSPTSADSR